MLPNKDNESIIKIVSARISHGLYPELFRDPRRHGAQLRRHILRMALRASHVHQVKFPTIVAFKDSFILLIQWKTNSWGVIVEKWYSELSTTS